MRAALAGFGLVLCVVADTGADTTILRPRPPGTAPLRGIARAAAFDVDPARLARLRAATAHRLDGFPVGDQRRTLELERFDPLGAARLQVVGPGGVRSVPPPDLVFFRGRVAGEPDSLAVVTAGATTLRALILASGGASVVGRDASGVHRAWSLADVDPTVHAPPAAFCMNDLVDLGRPAPDGAARASALTTTAPSHLGLRRAAVALETDQELRAKFASTSDALAYVASLFAEASAVYERDVDLALDLSFLRIWDTTDPWVSAVPDGQLAELRGYWNDPANGMAAAAGPRAVVHMLSGKPVLGGIAYVDAACLAAWGYGVSQVFGSFDLDNPNGIWDLAVVMHELGHNFGTEHTHCYVPPIDTCYNGEPGCWDGAVTSSRGTVMSYCHQHAGGLANLDLRFHDRVRDLLHTTTAAAECLVLDGSSPCGNGVLDDGEECDDGNRSAGDGCSASCRLEVCGNGFLDPGEECDDGNTVAGDGCSPTCGLERCGDGEIQAGEECDDGNLVAGDGCSPTCQLERCALRLPHQSMWAATRLLVHPAPRDGLALRAVFEIPADATIAVLEHGLTVLGETDAGDAALDVTVPGGDGWRQRGTRMRYRDGSGAADGVRKVIVKTRTRGERTRVRVLVVGQGGGYPASLDAMPARLTVVLGGAEAGSAGACGEWQMGLGSCRSERGGKRFICR